MGWLVLGPALRLAFYTIAHGNDLKQWRSSGIRFSDVLSGARMGVVVSLAHCCFVAGRRLEGDTFPGGVNDLGVQWHQDCSGTFAVAQ